MEKMHLKLGIWPQEAFDFEVDPGEENEVMDARWNYFQHTVSMPAGPEIPPCPRCFSCWLCTDSPPDPGAMPPEQSGNAVPTAAHIAEAKGAIADWIETHRPVLFRPGADGNVAALSNSVR